MIYKIIVDKQVEKQLKKIPKYEQNKIRQTIHNLRLNPRPPGCKKLACHSNDVYRVRWGVYRVKYEIHEDILTIILLKAGKRENFFDDLS